ncbi:hypothetical protein [Kribbella sp. NPDC051620]|uniref:hypothetical protein n=1 Tax=Kribbella sp. NPDC051620 TaxID=3364120 RepID=UPI00379184B5
MMSVLEKVSPETRRKTGWLLPWGIGAVLSLVVTDADKVLSRSDRLGMGALALAGLLGGVLWQWYSPRDLAERLAFPAGATILIAVLLMLPIGEASTAGPDYSYWFPLGLIAGLVLATRWQQLRAED